MASPKANEIANICRATPKDVRNAVVAAQKALNAWSQVEPYTKGLILYRIAETLSGRKEQFVKLVQLSGGTRSAAAKEVDHAIDTFIYYAGWCDKYQQISGTVNPVSAPYFSFSFAQPNGVVAMIFPESSGLAGLVGCLAPALAGSNTVVGLAAQNHAMITIELCEVLIASDVPGGVVNVLTGYADELVSVLASHLDINALVHNSTDKELIKQIHTLASQNVKRVANWSDQNWSSKKSFSLDRITDLQEIKTSWHPVGI